MKTASTAVKNLLANSKTFYMAEVLTIQLNSLLSGSVGISIDGTPWTGAIRTVGTGKQFATLEAAIVDANNAGQDSVILVDPGTYTDYFVATRKFYIRGMGARPQDTVWNITSGNDWYFTSDFYLENITVVPAGSFQDAIMPTRSTGHTVKINKCKIGGAGNTYPFNNLYNYYTNTISISHTTLIKGYAHLCAMNLPYVSLSKVAYNGDFGIYGCQGDLALADIAPDGTAGYGYQDGDCSLITPNVSLRYSSVDVDITWQGQVFASKGMPFTRSKITQIRGIEVDTLQINAFPTTAQIGGIGMLAAIRNGALDGALIKLERLFFTAFGTTPVGGITLFTGKVSEIELGRTHAEISVKSNLELLNVQWPLNVYQPSCMWTLYDAGCGLSQKAFTTAGTVASGSTASIIKSNLGAADAYYDKGVITFTSGQNTGISRTVKAYLLTDGAVQVILPLPYVPAAGDTFNIYPGCDKQLATCTSKFSNTDANGYAKFKGTPFIPVPETAL